MKKRFISAVALGLAMGMAFSAVGCTEAAFDKTDFTTAFDKTDFTTAKTEQEIYECVQYGVEQLAAYTGAMTVETTEKYSGSEGDSVGTEEESYKYSWDTSSKKLFMTYQEVENSTESDGTESVTETSTYAMTSKVFKENDKYYMYSKESEETGSEKQTQEGYTSMTESYVDLSLSSISSMFQEVGAVAVDTTDFATLKNAYATVYAEQLAEEQKTNANAKATAEVTATNDNGTLTVKIATSTETNQDMGGVTALVKKTEENTIVAKDGKVAEVIEKVAATATMTVEGETMTMDGEMTSSAKFTYSFDQTAYDAITVSLPTDSSQIQEMGSSYEELEKTLVVDGVEMSVSTYVTSDTTVESVFRQLISYTSLTSNSEAYALSWYTDEACTTAFDPANVTMDNFKNIEKLYGKTTVNDGYALIVSQYAGRDDRTDAYKIVFEEKDYNYDHANFSYETVSETAANNVYSFRESSFDEIYVNGVKTETSFTYENKGKYVIKYVNVTTNADCSIFDIDF